MVHVDYNSRRAIMDFIIAPSIGAGAVQTSKRVYKVVIGL